MKPSPNSPQAQPQLQVYENLTLTPHKSGTSVLDYTSIALELVSNVADGALNVPGLKPAAKVALQIVQVIKVSEQQLILKRILMKARLDCKEREN
jgi:hypothetical protein